VRGKPASVLPFFASSLRRFLASPLSFHMPLYEYVAKEDNTVIELLRPMSQADAPVQDPDGKGRTFVRKLSTFASGGGEGKSVSLGGGGGCCPCGKGAGACSRNN
jgi:hypothetical protein